MNNALCRALLVLLQSANPSTNVMCGHDQVVTAGSFLPLPGSSGTARMEDDGTIVLVVSRIGAPQTTMRFAPTDPNYATLRSEIGQMSPGDVVPVSSFQP